MLKNTRCLNIGCGTDYKESGNRIEWVNLDSGNCKKDVDHDLETFPYPFDNGEFDFIYASHVLEHVSKDKFVNVVRELYRISKDGATWQILVPYFLSDNWGTDFTHQMTFTTRTFDFFDDNKPLRENGIIYGWDDIILDVTANEIPNEPNGPDIVFNIKVIK